jgi:hypothetical protein
MGGCKYGELCTQILLAFWGMGLVGNGGCLSHTLAFYEIIEDILLELPKLLISMVSCFYCDESGTHQFMQSLCSKRGICCY